MSGVLERDAVSALLVLAAAAVVFLDSDEDDSGAAGGGVAATPVVVFIQIVDAVGIGGPWLKCKCTSAHSGLPAAKVAITVSRDTSGSKDRLFGSIQVDERDDLCFAIVSMEAVNQVRSPPAHQDASGCDGIRRVARSLNTSDGHYFVKDFCTRIQTSVDQELALNLDPTGEILFCQWRGTDLHGYQLSLELKGRRQQVL
jgi:hypothetical protein